MDASADGAPSGEGSSTTGAEGSASVAGSSGDAEIDPECGGPVHDGDLDIDEGTDPREAAGIAHVLGDVRIEDTNLIDLSVLASLVCVDGHLLIQRNHRLETLHGLENLRRVTNAVSVSGSDWLVHVDALDGLRHAGGISFFGNPLLEELPTFPAGLTLVGDGFDPILFVGENHLTDLEALTSMGPITVEAEVLEIWIGLDETLRSTRGLAALADVDAAITLSIRGPDDPADAGLEEIDLTGFERVQSLRVAAPPTLHTLHAPDLREVAEIEIIGAHGLTDLSGFSALRRIEWSLGLGCDTGGGGGALTSLSGLESLESVPEIVITSLPELTSLTGLSTAVKVDRLRIGHNPQLATAAVEAFAAAVGVSDPLICGNAGDAGFCPEFGCPGLDVPPPR